MNLPGVLVCCSVPSRPNGALSSCDVTAVAAPAPEAAAVAEDWNDDDEDEEDDRDKEDASDNGDDDDEDDDEDEDGDEEDADAEEDEKVDGDEEVERDRETVDSRGSAADIASVTAVAATITTIRIDHDQLYRLRVFHILLTNAQVSGGVVTHATGGQQQLIGWPIASTALIVPA